MKILKGRNLKKKSKMYLKKKPSKSIWWWNIHDPIHQLKEIFCCGKHFQRTIFCHNAKIIPQNRHHPSRKSPCTRLQLSKNQSNLWLDLKENSYTKYNQKCLSQSKWFHWPTIAKRVIVLIQKLDWTTTSTLHKS